MQIRYPTALTREEYVRTEAWKIRFVVLCPIHPGADCRVTRYGTLVDIECVVRMVETTVRNSGHHELTPATAKEK